MVLISSIIQYKHVSISIPISSFSSILNGVISTDTDKNDTTVVIGYFPLKKSKHSLAEYRSWLENLIGFCQSPMVIFTSAEYYPILNSLRRNGSLPSYFIIDYNSPLEMPPIKPLVSTFERQHPIDPERRYHSVELYAVWCAKSYMLNRSAELNPFQTKYFFYLDAGAFRSPHYRFEAWPHGPAISTLFNNDRFALGLITPLPRRFCPLNSTIMDGPIKMDIIEGTFMGGPASAIRWWTSVYYTTIDEYRKKDLFIGKDQQVMNIIALAYADRFNMLLPFRTSCGNVWFVFGPILAEKSERQRLSFSSSCQQQNLSDVVIPFETICKDSNNVG